MDIVVEEGNVDVGNIAEPSYEVVARSGCSAQLSTNDTDEHELAIESEDSKVSVGNAAKQSHDVVGVGIDCIFNHAKVSTEADLGPQPDVIHLTSLDVPNESSQISSDADMVEQNKQDALDTLIRISQHKKPKKLNVARVVSEDYKCTPEDVKLIEYIKTLPGKQVVVNIDSVWLNRNDMECLFHGDIQLSGEALSAYIHCIGDEEHLLHREGGKVFLENTFISSLLKRDGDPKDDITMFRFKLPAILWDSRLNTKKRHQNLDHNVDEDGESSSDVQIIDTPYKYHYMDLQFCSITKFGRDPRLRVKPDINMLAKLLECWPDMEYDVLDCKQILLPFSFLGHFTLYVLNMDTRSIYIMDSMPIPSW
uniref:Ubiquitin-like protease family profile domain-containing protein n=1 Tax=Zea mays TaxID=4577 RepID=A0A804Q3W3_MAIZE